MKSPNDKILETMLNRLDAGESLTSIQADLGRDIDEYLPVLEFLTAQRLAVKPNPENLKQALLQSTLIEAQNATDDWGSFARVFASWKPWVGVGLSMFGVAILTTNWWAPSDSVVSPNTEFVQVQESAPAELAIMADLAAPMTRSAKVVEIQDVGMSDEKALMQAFMEDFESDMEDFEKTKAELESLYSDPLFSSLNPTQS